MSGLPKYLSTDEEVAKFLLRCASIGYPRSHKNVIALVQRINESRRIIGYVTNGVGNRFVNVTQTSLKPCLHVQTGLNETTLECAFMRLNVDRKHGLNHISSINANRLPSRLQRVL